MPDTYQVPVFEEFDPAFDEPMNDEEAHIARERDIAGAEHRAESERDAAIDAELEGQDQMDATIESAMEMMLDLRIRIKDTIETIKNAPGEVRGALLDHIKDRYDSETQEEFDMVDALMLQLLQDKSYL